MILIGFIVSFDFKSKFCICLAFYFFYIKEPTFISSFDVDDFVLFFIKEKSLEQLAENQDINYSRVVRVCKVLICIFFLNKKY